MKQLRAPNQHLPRVARVFVMGAMLTATLTIMGCASLRLHSEAREKQGEAVKKAWADVDLSGYFKTERDRHTALIQKQVDAYRRFLLVKRETQLRAIAEMPLNDIGFYFEEALTVAIGTPPALVGDDVPGGRRRKRTAEQLAMDQTERVHELLSDSVAAYKMEKEYMLEFAQTRARLQQEGVPAFDCSQYQQIIPADEVKQWAAAKPRADKPDPAELKAWAAKNLESAVSSRALINRAVAFCDRARLSREEIEANLEDYFGGQAGDAYDRLKAARRALKAQQARLTQAKLDYERALEAYNAEVKAAERGTSVEERSKAVAAALAHALNAVKTVGGLASEEFASGEHVAHMSALLESMKTSKEIASDDIPKLYVVASMLPQLADDIREIRHARKGQAIVSLLVARDIEQARMRAAARGRQLHESAIDILDQMVELSISRAHAISEGRVMLDDLMDANPVVRKLTAVDALAALKNPQDRFNLLTAASQYLDGSQRRAIDYQVLLLRWSALGREQAIDIAEIHAAMWSSLIDATVTQAAEFSAAGIKFGDIAKMVELAALLYIGRGVNK